MSPIGQSLLTNSHGQSLFAHQTSRKQTPTKNGPANETESGWSGNDPCLDLVRIGDGLITDLIQGIWSIGDQLSQENLLVGIEPGWQDSGWAKGHNVVLVPLVTLPQEAIEGLFRVCIQRIFWKHLDTVMGSQQCCQSACWWSATSTAECPHWRQKSPPWLDDDT